MISHSIHKYDLCEFSYLSQHGVRKPSNCEDLATSQDEVIEQVDGKTEVEDGDKYDFSNKSLKENKVQTKSVYVTVEVKEVSDGISVTSSKATRYLEKNL